MSNNIYNFPDNNTGECIQDDECYSTIGSDKTSDVCNKLNICKSNNKLDCVAPEKLKGVYKFPNYVKSRGKSCDGKNIPSCYAQTFWLQPSCLSTYNKPMVDKPIHFEWDTADASICKAKRYNTKKGDYVDLSIYGDMDTADYMELAQGGYENRSKWGHWQTHGCMFPGSHLPSPHCDGNNEWHVSPNRKPCSWFKSTF